MFYIFIQKSSNTYINIFLQYYSRKQSYTTYIYLLTILPTYRYIHNERKYTTVYIFSHHFTYNIVYIAILDKLHTMQYVIHIIFFQAIIIINIQNISKYKLCTYKILYKTKFKLQISITHLLYIYYLEIFYIHM